MDEVSYHLGSYVEPGPQSLLFRGTQGGPLRRTMLQRAWDATRKRIGVEHLHFHDLRHTGDTLAAATGASTRELMARMGHASSEAALRYQYEYATRERDAVIAAGLDTIVANAVEAAAEAATVEKGGMATVTSLEEHKAARHRVVGQFDPAEALTPRRQPVV